MGGFTITWAAAYTVKKRKNIMKRRIDTKLGKSNDFGGNAVNIDLTAIIVAAINGIISLFDDEEEEFKCPKGQVYDKELKKCVDEPKTL